MLIEQVIKEIKEEVSYNLDISRDYTDDEIRELIEKMVFEKSCSLYLDSSKKFEIVNTVFNSMRRLDVLQPLIDDTSVNDIMINGHRHVYVERHGTISKQPVGFENEEKLYNIIQSIVSKVNRVVNESSPIVDARLRDGSRVNVVLPPIALNGPVMTIRKFPDKPFTINQLIKMETVTEAAANLLEMLVKAKYNIFICGGTSSGKTTFLNALSGFIPSHERIVTIEDSAELQIHGIDNIVSLETRNANTEGKGEITIRDLIKASLRMRPDRIIVGEVRGAEALDMLQAMNTGHDGSLSTGHGNSALDMLSRLETMVVCSALLPLDAIRRQIASALDIIIHLGRVRGMSRKVLEITELVAYKNNEFELNPLFIYEEQYGAIDCQTTGGLKDTGRRLINTAKLKMAGIRY